jgi:hypothetical protein
MDQQQQQLQHERNDSFSSSSAGYLASSSPADVRKWLSQWPRQLKELDKFMIELRLDAAVSDNSQLGLGR